MCDVRERESSEGNRKQEMDGEKKRRNPAKRGVGKKKKKSDMLVLGIIDPGAHPRRL